MAEEALTKLVLNNKIVEMRKNVRQARIHCISKLCKEIRKLKDKKGSEQQVLKNHRKADKLVEQLSVMKKVKPDVVSKFALMNEKSMIEITNDVSESLENKALARLGNHKSIQEKISEFRKTFPDWKKSLEFLFETLGDKYKNRKPNKPAISGRKNTKSKHERKNADCILKSEKENEEKSGQPQIASIKTSSGKWAVEDSEHVHANKMKVCGSLIDISDGDETLEKLSLVKVKPSVKISNVLPKTETIPNFEENVGNSSDSSVNCDKDFPEIAADPFFITEDNQEYLSISATQIASEEKSNSNQDKKISKYQLKSDQFNGKSRSFNPNFKQNRDSFRQSDFKKYRSSVMTKSKVDNANNETAINSLHPSWVAKKKQSNIVQISQFQGKKTKFND